ncbi:hypothetical protein ABBQ38_008158 [Trebouxia sp. C0009 RCD-2024]
MALAVTKLTLQLLKAGIVTEGDFKWCLCALLERASNLRLLAAAKLLYTMRHLPIKNMVPFYRRLAQYCTRGFPGMDATLATRIKECVVIPRLVPVKERPATVLSLGQQEPGHDRASTLKDAPPVRILKRGSTALAL